MTVPNEVEVDEHDVSGSVDVCATLQTSIASDVAIRLTTSDDIGDLVLSGYYGVLTLFWFLT